MGTPMDFRSFLEGSSKIVADNSPAILSAIAVTGTLTTAYLSGRAAFKAAQIIEDETRNRDVDFEQDYKPMELREQVQLTWKLYIPAASTVVMTVACIVAANRIGTRRAAALAAAYKFSERATAEYKAKVVEKFGEKKEQAARDELAQERIDKNPPKNGEVLYTGRGEVLCHEAFTGRYFLSDMQTLRKAQNDTNIVVIRDGYASLSVFYDLVGLAPTTHSDEVGWNTDRILDLKFSTCLAPDDTACISVDYAVVPTREYANFH
jgi:hypothetical protein